MRKTIDRFVPKGQVGAIDRGQEGGRAVYRVEFTATDGTTQMLELAEDGSVIDLRGRLN